MILYFSPGACSLASHIALREVGADFDLERVDLKSKTTSQGRDYFKVNPKGYVPALALGSGEILTENVAILDWIAATYGKLGYDGILGRTRLLEVLAYISSELHKSFKPLFSDSSESEKNEAKDYIKKRLQFLAGRIDGDHLLGSRFTVADCYLFVILRWAETFGIDVPSELAAYRTTLMARPSIKDALQEEGLPARV